MSCSQTVSGPAVQLSRAFLDAESRLIEVAAEGGQSLNTFRDDFFQLIAQTRAAMDQNLVPSAEKRCILAITSNICAIATCFREEESRVKCAEKRSLSECAAVLQDSNNQHIGGASCSSHRAKKTSQTLKDSTVMGATKFKSCCDYFLGHFASPYPSNEVKNALAAQIGVEAPSITMWFTNNRRRSGWNNVMRDYANNNKELMRQLVDDVLNPSEARPVSEAARKAVLGAKAFIVRLSGDEISDVFREALEMEPMTPGELKAYTEERRVLQKRLTDLKRTQEEREAHKARKLVRAKAREQKAVRSAARGASNTPIAASGISSKRKRTDENEVAEMDHLDRPVKKSNMGADVVLDAFVVAPAPARSKRKRNESGCADADVVAPNDERSAKRARTSDAPRERKPRLRYVLDADGNPRRLRRKAQFRYRTSSSSPRAVPLFVLLCSRAFLQVLSPQQQERGILCLEVIYKSARSNLSLPLLSRNANTTSILTAPHHSLILLLPDFPPPTSAAEWPQTSHTLLTSLNPNPLIPPPNHARSGVTDVPRRLLQQLRGKFPSSSRMSTMR